ncbi:hypothetical protein Tco_0755686 [Tanacetum coccineum]
MRLHIRDADVQENGPINEAWYNNLMSYLKRQNEKWERNDEKRSVNATRCRWKKMEAALISEELQNDENEYQIEADDIESFLYDDLWSKEKSKRCGGGGLLSVPTWHLPLPRRHTTTLRRLQIFGFSSVLPARKRQKELVAGFGCEEEEECDADVAVCEAKMRRYISSPYLSLMTT